MKLVDVGYVARAHGLRGMVRVGGAGGDALDHLASVLVGDPAVEHRIESAQAVAEGYLVKFAGVDDRDGAEALRGQTLRARREDLPVLADDELYLDDLVGCQVFDRAGVAIGEVVRVDGGAAQDLLVIARPSGGEARVPLCEPIVVEVDLEHRRIVCDPPEGLLDL